MSSVSPASILYDANGNAIGVLGNPLRIDPTGSTAQPVSATALPLPSGAATSANQTNGDQRAVVRGGARGSTPAADVTSHAVDANRQALHVTICGNAQGVPDEHVGLVDANGNMIGVLLDGTVYRLQTASKVAKGASNLVYLDALDTGTDRGRLKTTLYSAEGEAVALGSVPANPTSLYNAFAKNGSAESLLVNGSVTPAVFTYPAHPTYNISLQELKFTIVANAITFGSDYFGSKAGPLPNGLLVEIVAGGYTGTVYNLRQNESFVNFASVGGFQWVVSSKDMASSSFLIGGGLKLMAGSSDQIRITVRDDLAAAGVYFKCFCKGNLLPV